MSIIKKMYLLAGCACAPFVLSTANAAEAEQIAADRVDEILVTAQTVSYRDVEPSVLGLPGSLFETPHAVQVISAQSWEKRNVTTIGEALRLTSGVSQSGTYATFRVGYILRGFTVSRILEDGFNVSSGARTAELASFSRIEVLKGASGVEAGNISSGGVINLVSKLPQAGFAARGDALLDTRGQRRGVGDVSVPLNADGTLSARGVVAYENSDSYRDYVERKSIYASPSIAWTPSDRTTVTALVRYQHADGTMDQGLPQHPVVLKLPVSRFLNEPDDSSDFKNFAARGWVEHQFSDNVRGRYGVSYSTSSYDNRFWSPRGVSADLTKGLYAAVIERSKTKELIGQGDIRVHADWSEDWKGDFTVGVEAHSERVRATSQSAPGTPSQISLTDPVYGVRVFGNVVNAYNRDRTKWIAFTAQQQQNWRDSLTFSAGLRADFSKVSRLVENSGLYREKSYSKVSPFVGLSYRPVAPVNLYANYSRSFTNQIGTQLAGGQIADPLIGRQYEAGIKVGTIDGRLGGTLSVFDVTQSNVLTATQIPNISIQTGEQRSRGMELEFTAIPVKGWTIEAAYTLLDAEVRKDSAIPAGTRTANNAKNSLNLWSSYEVLNGGLAGFTIGGGMFYVGKRPNAITGLIYTLPSYTRFDASLGYKSQNWDATLYFENITDEVYHYSRGPVIHPQQPFTISARLSVHI